VPKFAANSPMCVVVCKVRRELNQVLSTVE
jgi:hypothetical protein